jgi:hypothetical protein
MNMMMLKATHRRNLKRKLMGIHRRTLKRIHRKMLRARAYTLSPPRVHRRSEGWTL